MSGDYLVIYDEEDSQDDTEDELVLDIRTLRQAFRKHLDVETSVHVDIQNVSSSAGLIGLISTCLGAVIAFAGIFVFATTYPSEWFVGREIAGTSLRRMVTVLVLVGALLLMGGTILTAYGRQVTARGRIDHAHLVEKSVHTHSDLS